MLLPLLAVTALASASNVGQQPNTVRFNVGLFSAVGELGMTYSRVLTDHFDFEVGVGLGFSGAQLSALPKLFIGSAHERFVCGIGLSLAVPGVERYRDDVATGESTQIAIIWLNADLAGYEHRSDSGLTILIAGGFTTSLTSGRMREVWEGSGAIHLSGFTAPQVRVALGRSF